MAAQYEYIELRPTSSIGTLKLSYTQPFGEKHDYDFRVRVPVVSTGVLGDSSYGLGDMSLRINHVFGLTRDHGFVAQGELFFDTANRLELGTGKTVFKGTLIYALFQSNGAIFAPAAVQTNSVGGNSARAKVNNTVFDFYYVPKLKDPANFVTIDPAVTLDHQTHKQFASLAVTLGRSTGPAFGGAGQLFVKPTMFAGGERSGNWGLEIGYKVIGF
jgi:hypothetical protein